mgnify:CR=1 FL=1
MFQLNVKLRIGEANYEGHVMQGWTPYHIEFFTTKKMLHDRMEEYKMAGIEAVLGKKTKELLG